jgi:hypothetical protein
VFKRRERIYGESTKQKGVSEQLAQATSFIALILGTQQYKPCPVG